LSKIGQKFKARGLQKRQEHKANYTTVYVGYVCPAAGCKTNFQICIDVTVATAHPTKNHVEFQYTACKTNDRICFEVTVAKTHNDLSNNFFVEFQHTPTGNTSRTGLVRRLL
jgi:hypothetical protein